MRPAVRECVGYGLVGALSFLVLAQGYRLVTDRGPSLAVLLVVGVAVGVVATGATYALRRHLVSKRRV